jgi:dienelactone hydrolase
MRKALWRSSALLAFAALLGGFFGVGPTRADLNKSLSGTIDGADYRIEVPDNWNGTLLLYSHGTVLPGSPNPAVDAADSASGAWLLRAGFALAGSSFSSTGYVLADALHDNIALLDYFTSTVGKPKRTIAWGVSQGGSIVGELVQRFPDRFDGALPISGQLGGAVGAQNLRLDSAFVLQTLLPGGSDLTIVNIADPYASLGKAQAVIARAQEAPEGRARLALAAAVADLPGWYLSTSPPPAADDYAAQESNQFNWFKTPDLTFMIAYRAIIEGLAGGNGSYNDRTDYRAQLEMSIDRDEVYALYSAADLSLDADLRTLADAPRIQRDVAKTQYLIDNTVYDGQLQLPVLTLHTVGDGLVPVQAEAAYAATVGSAGKSGLLRQAFVNRAGHVTFTPAEKVAGLVTLLHRLDVGRWENDDAAALNAQAAALGDELNTLAPGTVAYLPSVPTAQQPAFVDYQPAPFLRPFDARCATGEVVAPIVGDLQPGCL